MRVVLCSRHSSELAGGYQLTHQNACPSLDALSAVVGKATDGNDRILRNGEDTRYLDKPQSDELYKIYQ